jgi:hypothetical protein
MRHELTDFEWAAILTTPPHFSSARILRRFAGTGAGPTDAMAGILPGRYCRRCGDRAQDDKPQKTPAGFGARAAFLVDPSRLADQLMP